MSRYDQITGLMREAADQGNAQRVSDLCTLALCSPAVNPGEYRQIFEMTVQLQRQMSAGVVC